MGSRVRKGVVELEAGGGLQPGQLLQEVLLVLVPTLLLLAACVMCWQ